MEVGRLLAAGAAVNQHRPEHDAEHHHTDDHTDPENGHVQIEEVCP